MEKCKVSVMHELRRIWAMSIKYKSAQSFFSWLLSTFERYAAPKFRGFVEYCFARPKLRSIWGHWHMWCWRYVYSLGHRFTNEKRWFEISSWGRLPDGCSKNPTTWIQGSWTPFSTEITSLWISNKRHNFDDFSSFKAPSSAPLIERYILRLRQRGRCCFCAACLIIGNFIPALWLKLKP